MFFTFFIDWLKLLFSDFRPNQKCLLFKNKALVLSETYLGETLIPSNYPKLILFALQNG